MDRRLEKKEADIGCSSLNTTRNVDQRHSTWAAESSHILARSVSEGTGVCANKELAALLAHASGKSVVLPLRFGDDERGIFEESPAREEGSVDPGPRTSSGGA